MRDGRDTVAFINVVFLLMVFFIIAGTANRKDASILPPQVDDRLTTTAERGMEVTINRRGELVCGGAAMGLEQLADCLGDAEVVIIRADGGVTSGRFYQLMDSFKGKQIRLTVRGM